MVAINFKLFSIRTKRTESESGLNITRRRSSDFGEIRRASHFSAGVPALIDSETAEKTDPPCLARLDKPDCRLCFIAFK